MELTIITENNYNKTFFILTAFGMIYGTILIATSASYCVQLDNAYDKFKCTPTVSNGSLIDSSFGTDDPTQKNLPDAADVGVNTTSNTEDISASNDIRIMSSTIAISASATKTISAATATTVHRLNKTTTPTTTPTTPLPPTTPPGSTTLPSDEKFDIFCERYSKWRACSIVGMFVATLLLVYSIGNIYYKYSGTNEGYLALDSPEEHDRIHLCSLGFVAIASIVMVTTIFSVLIDTQANTISYASYKWLKPTAVGNIVVLGLGIGSVLLGVLVRVVFMPVVRCIADFRDSH